MRRGRAQGPSSSRSSIIKCTRTHRHPTRQGVAAWGGGMGLTGRGRQGGCCTHSEACLKLSCKARAGISSNSLSNAERGEGGKDAEFAGSPPKSGRENGCREHSERPFEGGGEGKREVVGGRGEPPSVLFRLVLLFWLYTKAALNTKRNCLSVHLFQRA